MRRSLLRSCLLAAGLLACGPAHANGYQRPDRTLVRDAAGTPTGVLLAPADFDDLLRSRHAGDGCKRDLLATQGELVRRGREAERLTEEMGVHLRERRRLAPLLGLGAVLSCAVAFGLGAAGRRRA